MMRPGIVLHLVLSLGLLVLSISPAFANAFPNSLWIGNDTNAGAPILNTDTSGNVLRLGPPGSGVGFGVDLVTSELFVNDFFSSAAVYDLNTLAFIRRVPFIGGSIVCEDLS